MLIIDSRMRKIEKEKLKNLGYELFEIPINPNLYFEISAHPDIHCCKIENKLISCLDIPNSIKGLNNLKSKYPEDINYNACIINNFLIHNFKYTEPKILETANKFNFQKIHINQGYSKCSIAVIDNKSIILTDSSIAKILKSKGLNILLLNENILHNIYLYKNSKLEYSSMHGFIGGTISRIDDFIFVSGDLNNIDSKKIIRNFIQSKNLKLIDFPGLDLIDYGGIIQIKKAIC